MKTTRGLFAILTVFVLIAAACGGNDDDSTAPAPTTAAPADEAAAAEPEPTQAPAETAAAEPETTQAPAEEMPAESDGTGYSVAFLFDLFVEDGGWNSTHYRGVEQVRAAFPGLDVQVLEEISPGVATINAAEELAADGVDMVITTFYSMDEILEVAADYPDTIFLTWAGWQTAENVGHYDAATEDGRYLDGLIAGSITESGLIGYPAGFPIEEVNRALNAFTIGVREMNPDAVVQAVYINSWYDPPVEQQAAEALANAGADVLAHELNSPAVAQVAESRGLNVIGYSSDRSAEAPNAWLSSFRFEWGPTTSTRSRP